mmetsp:Transcript_29255/g.48340  ORF Transcript_29255/g.48340 Transcript_29255/m.48340 type:complete len:294 (-) Transcript_29255:49-930(-)
MGRQCTPTPTPTVSRTAVLELFTKQPKKSIITVPECKDHHTISRTRTIHHRIKLITITTILKVTGETLHLRSPQKELDIQLFLQDSRTSACTMIANRKCLTTVVPADMPSPINAECSWPLLRILTPSPIANATSALTLSRSLLPQKRMFPLGIPRAPKSSCSVKWAFGACIARTSAPRIAPSELSATHPPFRASTRLWLICNAFTLNSAGKFTTTSAKCTSHSRQHGRVEWDLHKHTGFRVPSSCTCPIRKTEFALHRLVRQATSRLYKMIYLLLMCSERVIYVSNLKRRQKK